MLQDRGVESPDPLRRLFLLNCPPASSREIDCSPKCSILPLQMNRPTRVGRDCASWVRHSVKALIDGRAIIVYPLRPDLD
jgi:hypothetical protein